MTLPACLYDAARGNIQRGKKGRRAVSFVVVCPRSGASPFQRQSRLCAVECLDLALLIEREDNGTLWRIDVETNDISQLLNELRVSRQLKRLHSVWLEPVGFPDAGDCRMMPSGDLSHKPRAPVSANVGRR